MSTRQRRGAKVLLGVQFAWPARSSWAEVAQVVTVVDEQTFVLLDGTITPRPL